MDVVCAWCGKQIGEAPGEGISHGICPECVKEYFPEEAEKVLGTDEELYEGCEDCHVAVTASMVADICAANPEEAGRCELISRGLESESTEPVEWLKAMIQAAEEATGGAKEEMVAAVAELMDYLKSRNSPFLQTLENPPPG